ncbi:MAG: hypothetical protein R3B89_07630 [Polyangiaceae bacterium]
MVAASIHVLDAIAIFQLGLALGARRDREKELPEQRRALLGHRRVLEQGHIGLHLDVDARLSALEPDIVDVAHGNAGDLDLGVFGDPRRRPGGRVLV